MENKREIGEKEFQEIVNKQKDLFEYEILFTSAKTGHNVTEIFHLIIKKMRKTGAGRKIVETKKKKKCFIF